jgi:hypothetical protein
MDAKVGHFQCKCLRPLAVALLFRQGKCSLILNLPSSSENVNFAHGQTNRILVPFLQYAPKYLVQQLDNCYHASRTWLCRGNFLRPLVEYCCERKKENINESVCVREREIFVLA